MDSPRVRLKPFSLLFAVVGLAGTVCGLTVLFLSMREVMEIGGACAEGGAYEIARPCPDGVPALMTGGIFGGLVFLAVFGVAASNLGGGYNRLVLWAWPALFLSLGWNFLEYGLDPPVGDGVSVSWLFCAALFFLMGGLPLLFLLTPSQLRQTFWPRAGEEKKRRAPLGLRTVERVLERSSGDSSGKPVVNPRFTVPAPSGAEERKAAAPPPARPYPAATGPGATAFMTDTFLPKPAPRADQGDLVAQLERLARLHAEGALDAGEYERAKQAVLQGKGT